MKEIASMTAHPNVTCIILNWNGWQDTIDCLNALKRCSYPKLTAIVVDNGSTNASVAMIKAAHADIVLLESGGNLGFAGGNNIGIRYALAHGADYVWLLNNDTEAAPDALSALVTKAVADKRIGAVASICYYADNPSIVQVWAGARVNLWVGYCRNTNDPHPDDWFHSLYGASMLVSCSAIEEAGMLDEGFFHYWEETEFCLRLRKKGWLLASAPESHILHKVAASSNGNGLILVRYFTASGLRILRLHSKAPRLAMFFFLTARFLRRILRFQFSQCRSVWEGVRDYRDSLPVIPKTR
jgi:GT2 family glycosyltransferase